MIGKIGIVGCGNWGKNLVRNFCQNLGSDQVICCDQSGQVLESLAVQYPGIGLCNNVEQIWQDSSVSCVVIATPALSHYSMVRNALSVGKHVLVEKPLTTSAAQASELCNMAGRQNLVLMVDHLLLFHPALQQLQRKIELGELGTIYQIYSRRTNLGVVRSEENALWSLGAHDVAVMVRLVGEKPARVTAVGGIYLQPQASIQDVVFVTLAFPGGQIGHMHLSWHDPRKAREITVVGSRKMALFDDGEAIEKLRIYDMGVEVSSHDCSFPIRNDGVDVIAIGSEEPLSLLCQHFLDSVDRGQVSLSSGRSGLEVVQILEAAQTSLDSKGTPVLLSE